MRTPAMVLLVLCSACANHRWFAPRENRNGYGPEGDPAAVYAIGAPGLGELRVWSSGASGVEIDGADAVELRVGFEIENTGTVPLAVDTASVQCDDVWVGDQHTTGLQPVRSAGAVEAPAGGSARVEFVFVPPGVQRARAIDGFTVRFAVRTGDKPVMVQVTPFLPWVRDDEWRDDRWYWRRSWWWGPGAGFGYYHPHAHW